MKKGHYYNDLPALIPVDFVYHRACIGVKYDPVFESRWNASNKFQRGIIFVPQITAADDVYDNASLHLQFLQDHNPAWREKEILKVYKNYSYVKKILLQRFGKVLHLNVVLDVPRISRDILYDISGAECEFFQNNPEASLEVDYLKFNPDNPVHIPDAKVIYQNG